MKNFLLRFLLLFIFVSSAGISAFGQITIGTGTTTGQNIPLEMYYGYTYSQSIYLSSEIGATGDITGLEWTYSGTSHSNDIIIYVGHSSKNTFSGSSDWEAIGNLTEVYDGNVSFAPGTISINFDNAFTYNGTDNLIIAVEENSSGYNSNSDEFSCSAATSRSITQYSDSVNADPSSPPTGSVKNYIPNVTLLGITQACPAPSAMASSNVMSSTADLAWTPGNTETAWNLEWKAGADFAPGTGAEDASALATTTASYSMSSLTDASTYYVYYQADCGGDESLWIGPHTLTTLCIAVDDFNEDFDASATTPNCWEAYDPSSGSSYSSTSYANSGTRSWYIYNSYYYDVGLISPELTTLGSAYRLKFHAYSTSSSTRTLRVGTADNTGTFTEFTTVTLAASYAWEEFVIDFSSYAGSDTRLMIDHGNASSYQSFYIDDMVWEELPSCLEPNTLTATGITAESASLSWTPGGSGETAWEVTVQTAGTGIPTAAGTATGNPYNATGLTAQTEYEFYVRANCGTGDLSPWVGPYNFTTLCAAESAPYLQDFENSGSIPDCWSQGIGNSENWLFSSSNTDYGPTGDHTTGSGYFAWIDDSSPNNTATTLETPLIDLSGVTLPQLEFWMWSEDHGSGSGLQLDVDIYSGGSWTNLTTLDIENTGWEKQEFLLSAYAGQTVQLRFVGNEQGSGYQEDLGIDDIAIVEAPACPNPSEMTGTSITTSGASLSWTAGNTETAWNIEWKADADFAAGTGAEDNSASATTTPTYTMSGLTDNTTYYVYYQADCGASDISEWVGPYSFTTLCTAATEFSENFDATAVEDVPGCWTELIDDGASLFAYAYVRATNANSGVNSLSMYNQSSNSGNVIIVSPVLSNINAGTHRLRFYARNSTASQDIEVGTITDPSDGSTFTSLEAVDLNTTYGQYIVDFSSYAGSDTYIAIRRVLSSTYTYVNLDDIAWEAIPVNPNCSELSSPADAATDINVTTNLSWASNIDATGYKLSIGTTSGGTEILSSSDLGDVTSYDPPADLAYNTTYYVTLSAYNANGDAIGCTETTFTTLDGCITPSSPTNGSTTAAIAPTISWSNYNGATKYIISIGTTAGGTDILNGLDKGTSTSHSVSGLSYTTEYFVSVKVENANGVTSAACDSYSFTTQGNPNFGGGPDGTDPNHPNSGGYYFANSLAAGNGLMTQPTYDWIDPVAAGHTQVPFTSVDDSALQEAIGFSFTLYGTTYTDAYIGTNGYIALGSSYSTSPANHSIPNNSNGSATRAMIYVAGADLDGDNSEAKIYAGGDADHFVVTWYKYEDYNDQTEYITCQLVLYPNGRILMQYNDVESTLDEDTDLLNDILIGIENAAGDKGIQYRNNGSGGPMFGSPLALAFNTSENALALPAELTSFTGKAMDKYNTLKWETAAELNTSEFAIERSLNGRDNWEVIGIERAAGNSDEAISYSFDDMRPATQAYYRLNTIDFDGSAQVSNIVSIKRDANDFDVILVAPNPTTAKATVTFESNKDAQVNATVTDITGKVISTLTQGAISGLNNMTIDLSNAPSGVYFLTMNNGVNNITRRIVKN